MAKSMRFRSALFLQKAEVLADQKEMVASRLGAALPDLTLHFAGSAEDVPEGLSVDIVIAPTLPWLPGALARLGAYRWIHFLSAGVEKIWDMPFDKEGVLLTKSSGVHGAPMSEYAVGAMLYFAKQFNRFAEQAREARWERTWLDELTGRTVMILGMGHIGGMVAERARVFGMDVIGVQRQPRPARGDERIVALHAVPDYLSEVDYLVVCLPLTEATHHLVNRDFIGRLKPGAVVVDISRGGVVEEASVVEALESGQLKGAALDVFEQQPLPPESALWRDSRVLVTPHVSGTSPHYMQRALDVFVRNAKALEAGEAPVTAVDVAAGY